MRNHDDDTPLGIKRAFVAGQALSVQLRDEFLVGGHEQLERRAFADLGSEGAGRTEGQPHLHPGLGSEGGRDLGDSELQIGRGGDHRRLSFGGCGQGKDGEGCPAEEHEGFQGIAAVDHERLLSAICAKANETA